MNMKFRQIVSLGHFMKVNIGKRSGSLSVGIPGMHLNFGSRGVRSTVGIPDTGLSFETKTKPAQIGLWKLLICVVILLALIQMSL